jgi:hypothetical protein
MSIVIQKVGTLMCKFTLILVMSKMDLVAHIEGMLQSLYAFFLNNLNRFLEFLILY